MADSSDAQIKDRDTYEALRDKGYGKSKAAAIANAQANNDMDPATKGGKAPPYEEWTKGALYDRAKELDIECRSQMSKSDLIDALRNQ